MKIAASAAAAAAHWVFVTQPAGKMLQLNECREFSGGFIND
jgi:hypothetical protein